MRRPSAVLRRFARASAPSSAAPFFAFAFFFFFSSFMFLSIPVPFRVSSLPALGQQDEDEDEGCFRFSAFLPRKISSISSPGFFLLPPAPRVCFFGSAGGGGGDGFFFLWGRVVAMFGAEEESGGAQSKSMREREPPVLCLCEKKGRTETDLGYLRIILRICARWRKNFESETKTGRTKTTDYYENPDIVRVIIVLTIRPGF